MEKQKMKPSEVVTKKYNGWRNFPTWLLYTHLSDEKFDYYQNLLINIPDLSDAMTFMESRMRREVRSFILLPATMIDKRSVSAWVTGCIIGAPDWALWHDIAEALLHGPILAKEETDELTYIFYSALLSIDLSFILLEANGEERLKKWVSEFCITWASPKYRNRERGGNLSKAMVAILELYLNHIDWEAIVKSFVSFENGEEE